MANKKQSSPKEATKAAKVLSNPHSSKLDRSLAGSVLSQARGKGKKQPILSFEFNDLRDSRIGDIHILPNHEGRFFDISEPISINNAHYACPL